MSTNFSFAKLVLIENENLTVKYDKLKIEYDKLKVEYDEHMEVNLEHDLISANWECVREQHLIDGGIWAERARRTSLSLIPRTVRAYESLFHELGITHEGLNSFREYQARWAEYILTMSPEPKTLLKVTSKGIKYFVYKGDNPQDMYEYNEKRFDKIVGKRTKIDGKYNIELF
jgi:hypothetical protein